MNGKADPIGAAPEARSVRFIVLLFGACAAPIFWLGQLMLGYGVTAQRCYPGDHPLNLATGALSGPLMLFDAVAFLACAAGALASWRCWHRIRAGARPVPRTGEDRNRFLAMWGMLSSLWFFFAILFNAIASVMVPPCPG